MAKSKLNIDGQIEHLKEKGISFLLVDENEARNILSNHTYYFKIKSYAKNYSKDKNGKYIDLEFAYLVELSKLDMYLRRILLDITLDLEHALKTSLLNDFNKTQEDGYRIVNSFLNSSRGENAQKYINGLKNRTDNTTSSILVKKYQTNLPIWVLIEVIQLHDLMKFYEFFYGKYNTFYAKSELSFITNAIFSTKCLRNLAAHNNCIIKNIFEKNAQKIQKQCKQELACNTKTIEKYGEKLDEILQNQQISDFYMMILLMKRIVKSDGLKNHIKKEISNFFKKICMTKKRQRYFLRNKSIKKRARAIYMGYQTIIK